MSDTETKTEPTVREPVPYDRFQSVVTEKNTLASEVTNLRGEVQKLAEKAATVDTLSTQLNEWKTKASDAEGRFTVYTEFSGALGTSDADVITTFESKYKSLDEKDRPTRAAWVEGLRTKVEEAPTLLRPFLVKAEDKPAGGKPEADKKPTPRANGGGPNPPGAPSQYSEAEIARIHSEAKRTGDWTKFREVRKQWGGK